jgi:hypothetical protein
MSSPALSWEETSVDGIDGALWQMEVGGLWPGTQYFFTVGAAATGRGPVWAQSILRQTVTTIPTAPSNISAVATGPQSISVLWQQPSDDGGSSVTQYQVYYRVAQSGGGWVMTILQGQGTVLSLAGLAPVTDYEMYVVAVNANGVSPRTVGVAEATTLEDDAPVSPPLLLAGAFTSLAQGITLTFDSASDRGVASELTTAGGCEALLSFTGISFASCSWMSDSELLITLGGGSSILPGDSITLHADKLKALCNLVTTGCGNWGFNQEQSVTVAAPANALSPAVVLTGPSTVGICDNVTLNSAASSGSGGREFTDFTWTIGTLLSNGSPGISEPRLVDSASAASAANSPKFFMVGTWLQAGGSYAVTLSLTNFLGVTSSEVFTLTKLSLPVPTVEIDGGSFHTAFRSDGVSLTAKASAPSCVVLDSMRVTYSWRINGQALDNHNIAVGPTKLKLPALSSFLVSGATSTITAIVEDSNGGSNSATASLIVLSSPLSPVIGGGDRTVGFDSGLSLDASGSLDPDNETAPMQYTWSCSPLMSTAPDCGPEATQAAVTANQGLGMALLTLPGGSLASDSKFLWEVRVSKDSRVASAGVTVTVVAGNPVAIGIDGSCCTSKVNPSQRVIIQATVVTGSAAVSASTVWSQEKGDLNFGAVDFYPNVVSTPIFNSAALVINAGSLTPGAEYSFRLTGTAPGRASGASQVTLIVNAAPTSGSLAVVPPEGSVLDTKFAFEASQWVDEDTPLQYRFGYIDPSASTDKFVGTAQMNPLTQNVLLPQGTGANSTLMTFVVVLDSLGASVKSSSIVVVNELVLSTEELAGKTDELLSSALDTQDASGVFQAIGAIGAMINVDTSAVVDEDPCELAPDCAALDREECVADNKCGACTAGLIPSVGGPDNTDGCVAPLPVCSNTFKDATETDVDCGGGAHTGASQAAVCPACVEDRNCEIDSDCAADLVCISGTLKCAKPLKKCPVYSDVECSALGQCQFVTNTGDLLDSSVRCTVDRIDCEVQCSCDNGRYGLGCQMDEVEYQQMVALRESMLNALVSTEATTEKSPDDLAQQASFVTLLTAVPSELSSTSQDAVLGMMSRLVSSSGEGGMVEGMGQDVTSSLSALMDTDLLSRNTSTNSRRMLTPTDGAGDAIKQTLYGLSQASLMDSVDGESGVSISTKNIKMASAKQSASALAAAGMSVAPGGDAAGASFAVPGGTLEVDGDDSVNSQSVAFTKNPHGAVTPDGVSGVKSAVVGLSLSNGAGEIKVSNLSKPIMIVIPNTLPIDYGDGLVTAVFNHTCLRGVDEEVDFECPGEGSNQTVTIECDIPWWGSLSVEKSATCIATTGPMCTYWDYDLESWSEAGCVVHSWTADNTTCACTHLTDFSAATANVGAEAMAVLNQDPRDIFNPATMMKNIVVFATVFSMFGFCLCLMFQGWLKDRSDMRAMMPELKTDNPQGAVDKGALLMSGLFTGMRAARLRARQRYEDVCEKIEDGRMSLDSNLRRWLEQKRKRFAEEDERQHKRTEWGLPLPYLFTNMRQLFNRQLKEKHKLLSVWWVFLPSYTRPQRLLLVWVSIIGVMLANAIVYDVKNPSVNCANFSTDWDAHIRGIESDCNDQKDIAFGHAMCEWDANPEKEECLYREIPIGENLMGIIFAAVIAALCTAPMDIILAIGFKKVAPGKKVRTAMLKFEANKLNNISFEAACKNRSFAANMSRGKYTDAAKQLKPDNEDAKTGGELPLTTATVRLGDNVATDSAAATKPKREIDNHPLSKESIQRAMEGILEEDNKLLRTAGKMPMRRITKMSGTRRPFPCCCRKKKAMAVYATGPGAEETEEKTAKEGKTIDGVEEDLPRPAPSLLKRILRCRLKKTAPEKRWAKALARATREKRIEFELFGLTEGQRTARLLEMAREANMNPILKIMYGINKLPLQRVPTPLPIIFKYIFWTMGLGYVFFAGYFLLAFGVRRGADVTEAWLISMSCTVFSTMMVSWPATVFFMNVLLPRWLEPIISKFDVSGIRDTLMQRTGDLGGQVELALGLSAMSNGHGKGGGGGDGESNFDMEDGGMMAGMIGAGAGLAALVAGRKKKKGKKKKWAGIKHTVMSQRIPKWGANSFACSHPDVDKAPSSGSGGGIGLMSLMKRASSGGVEYEDGDVALARQLSTEQQYREHVRKLEAADERWRFGVKIMRKIMRVWATDTCGRLLGSTEDAQWAMIREKVEPQGQRALWAAWKNLAEQKLFCWLIEYAKVEAKKAEATAALAPAAGRGGAKVSPETDETAQQMPMRWIMQNEPPPTMVPPHERLRQLKAGDEAESTPLSSPTKRGKQSRKQLAQTREQAGSIMGAAEAQTAQASKGGKRVYMVGLNEQHMQSIILEYLVERDDALAEYEAWQTTLLDNPNRSAVLNSDAPLTPRDLEEGMQTQHIGMAYQQQMGYQQQTVQVAPDPSNAALHQHHRDQRAAEGKSLRGMKGLTGAHRRHLEDESLRAELQEMWEEREQTLVLVTQAEEALRRGIDEAAKTKEGRLLRRAERQGWVFDPWLGRSFSGSAFVQAMPVALPKDESPLTAQWAAQNGASKKALDWLTQAHKAGAEEAQTNAKEAPPISPKLLPPLAASVPAPGAMVPYELLPRIKSQEEGFYTDLLAMALDDGVVAASEEAKLATARAKYGISEEQHAQLLKEVQSGVAAAPAAQMSCQDVAEEENAAEEPQAAVAEPTVAEGLLEFGWPELPVATQRWVSVASTEQWMYDPWTGETLPLALPNSETTMLAWCTARSRANVKAHAKVSVAQAFKLPQKEEEKEEENAFALSIPNKQRRGLRAKAAALQLASDADVDRMISDMDGSAGKEKVASNIPRAFEC